MQVRGDTTFFNTLMGRTSLLLIEGWRYSLGLRDILPSVGSRKHDIPRSGPVLAKCIRVLDMFVSDKDDSTLELAICLSEGIPSPGQAWPGTLSSESEKR